MSKNETSQRITGAEIQSVYSTDENIPGQIPFVSFDEKDLTKFKNEILANRKSNDSSELPEDAESYLRNCLRRLSRKSKTEEKEVVVVVPEIEVTENVDVEINKKE